MPMLYYLVWIHIKMRINIKLPAANIKSFTTWASRSFIYIVLDINTTFMSLTPLLWSSRSFGLMTSYIKSSIFSFCSSVLSSTLTYPANGYVIPNAMRLAGFWKKIILYINISIIQSTWISHTHILHSCAIYNKRCIHFLSRSNRVSSHNLPEPDPRKQCCL